MRRRSVLLGLTVRDRAGDEVGTVVDTYPFDGGEVELAVVLVRGLGARRMMPASELRPRPGGLETGYSRAQVEDSPAIGESRHSGDDPWRAKSYWWWEEPAGSLPARWARSSGSSATPRRFPTSPSPTTTAS